MVSGMVSFLSAVVVMITVAVLTPALYGQLAFDSPSSVFGEDNSTPFNTVSGITTSTATTIEEEDDDLEMELDLIQTTPAVPNKPTESYFRVNGYDIKVRGQNTTIQEELHSHKISMDQDTVFLTSLGTLEVKNEEEGGITETQIMPVNGLVRIDRVREDPKQNITTYILNEGGLTVGDITITDFGLDSKDKK